MAREGKYLVSGALHDAIGRATETFAVPIDRIEVVGHEIHVDAGGRRMVYGTSISHAGTLMEDGVTAIPAAGGTTLEIVVFSGPLPIPTAAGFWRRLKKWIS